MRAAGRQMPMGDRGPVAKDLHHFLSDLAGTASQFVGYRHAVQYAAPLQFEITQAAKDALQA